ncbi:unnamed protein product [Rotaria magnacalcarata]|uniref:Uncharacterized protein n=1 Tax=Rotaria magnacalcarata TaxID=392030 RepID=A0A816SIJ8_9BILA|nr:unnamed protein product [Rotaria magnacalcarata]
MFIYPWHPETYKSGWLENIITNDNMDHFDQAPIATENNSIIHDNINSHSNYRNIFTNGFVNFLQNNRHGLQMILSFSITFAIVFTLMVIILIKLSKYFHMNLLFQGQFISYSLLRKS